MLATINVMTAAPCALCCQKTDDAVEAVFKDGFRGTFCRRHFWDARKARSDQQVQPPSERREAAPKGTP